MTHTHKPEGWRINVFGTQIFWCATLRVLVFTSSMVVIVVDV